MKKEFVGKTLCFIGDSILEHGHYTYNLRSYFQSKDEKCYVFNRGVAGNRAIMAQYILDDEVFFLNPDYAIICFGGNDLGVWLYDSLKEITPELLNKRKVRDDEYIKAHEILINKLRERGVEPIIMSPYAVDSFIVEKEYIETVADNDEKEDNLKPSFYKRKTFENINEAFKGLSKRLSDLCAKYGVRFFDMFEKSYSKMLSERDLHTQDGIHYTKDKGHTVLANIILEFLGCEPQSEFKKTPENDEIFELEQLERSTGYIRRCTPMNPHFGARTEEEILEYAKFNVNSSFEWGREAARNYIAHRHEIPRMKERLKELVYKL